jgi:O-antigen/teichoic acid export membrane protein
VASIQDQAFVAFRRAKFVLLKGVGLNLVRIVLLGVTVLFSAAFGIVAAGGLATLVALALGYFFLRWVEPGYGPAIVLDRQLVRKLLPFSFGNYGADLALFAPGLILPMMVVNVLGAESGGHFYVGWFIGYLLVWSISMYAAMSLFAEGSYDEESLARLTRNALILALAAVAIGVGAILLVGDKVLLAFGNEYADEATNLLRLVAVSALPATLVNVYLATERVRGNLGALVAVASVVAIVTLAISYPLLRTMGIAGAGVGLLVGQGLGAIIAIMRLFLGVWSREKRGSPGSGLAVAGVRPRKGGRFDRGC